MHREVVLMSKNLIGVHRALKMATGSEYTEEQLNYYRICCITTDELTDGLRTIFKQEWDNRYATTLGEWKDEAKNGQDFKNGESPRNQARNQELLATMINGNRAEWDCTMLFYAILYSDCIGRGLNAVVRSNVDDLRKFRNQDFAHLPRGHISEPKFQTAVAKVQSAFQALGLSTVKIQEIRNQANFPTSHLKKVLKEVDKLKKEVKVLEDQLQSETTPFCILPPKPLHDVAARNDEVAKITEVLKKLKETNESRLSYLYISGNPGSGKSQLAGLVAEQIFMQSTDAFVMTLDAANLDRLLDSYVSFARHLKCSEYAVTNTLNDLKTAEKIAYIKSLAGTKVELYASWLLLVDNVVSIPEIHVYLPDTGNSCWSKGQLLVTSQDTTSIPPDNSFIKQMSVSKGMAPSDATSLLATISGIVDDETAEKVAHALDYQPLALASAATFVKQLCDSKPSSNLGWRDFLEKLEKGQLKNTETFLSSTNASYPYSMTTAIALAVETSMSSDRVLNHAFNIISLCAPQPLNLDIVTNYVQKAEENSDMNTEGEFEDTDVIGLRIRKSSLLLLEEDNGEVYVRIHQVVRDVIQCLIRQHSETERFAVVHVSVLSLNQFIVDRKAELNDYTANGFRLLAPHLRFLSIQIEAIFKENDLSEAIKNSIFKLKDYPNYLSCFGGICCSHFDLKAAKRFASLALKLISHDTVLYDSYAASALSLMGEVLFKMGKFEEGKRHFKRSLAIKQETLGPQHPSVATSYNNIASVLRDQGDLKKAKEYHERALAIQLQTLGRQHPSVATSYNNIASVLRDQGDLNQAKEYYERALAIQLQTLGPQNPFVAASYNNLAAVLRDQGDLKQAKEYLECALAIQLQTLGPQHPDVATSYSNLAGVLRDQGDLKQAKEYLECALAIQLQMLGPQHPSVALSYNNLAVVLRDQDDLKQAKEYYERALAIQLQTLGPQHLSVATSYSNLAAVLRDQGDLKQAKEYHERALPILLQTLGPQHPSVATSYNNLAVVLRDQGDLKQAKEYLERALAIQLHTLGPQHPDVSTSYNNLADVLQVLGDQGDLKQAKEYLERSLAIKQQTLGPQHPDVAICYNNLANVLGSEGDLKQAREYHERALAIQLQTLGPEHPHVATCYDNLAGVLRNLGDLKEAKKYHERALAIRLETLRPEHPDVASSYNNVAALLRDQGDLKEAKEYQERALAIQLQSLALQHPSVATSYNNIADVLRNQGDLNQAKEYHERALAIQLQTLGPQNPFVATSYNNIAGVLHDQGDLEQAKEYLERALSIRLQTLGPQHPDVATSYNNLAGVLGKQGDLKQAKEYLERALAIRSRNAGASTF